MQSLFSTFDFNTIYGLQLNWLTVFFFLIVNSSFWLVGSRLSQTIAFLMNIFHLEMMTLFQVRKMWGQTLFFVSLFMFVFSMNFLGLFPYIFTATSHLSFTLFLSIPLWLGSQVYSWAVFTDDMFCHLVPEGTPFLLMPLLVVIETVSNIIRPLTLAVRLVANMTAGHLLLVLLGSSGSVESGLMILVVVLMLVFLVSLELGVSLIQAYVFMLLLSLYTSEVDYSKSYS